MVVDFGFGVSVNVVPARDEYSCDDWVVENKMEVCNK